MRPLNTHPLFPVIECLRGAVVAIVVLLLVQTFLVEGLLTPHVVSSCSMSPALRGPHVALRCPECQTAFCIETGHLPQTSPDDLPLSWATCPACAFAQVPVFRDSFHKGDRIFIHRAIPSLRPIRRWETILFRTPDDGKLTVKRVVGLPGETLEIRDGDIYVDGKITAKPFAVQNEMRIPVPYGRWEMQMAEESGLYELAYYPIRNVPHTKPLFEMNDDSNESNIHSEELPRHVLYGVTNQLCENQWRGQDADNIFPVDDLMLTFDWRPENTMPLSLRLADVATEKPIELDFNPGDYTLRVSIDVNTFQSDLPRLATDNPHRIVVSLFDRQLTVAVDDSIIFEQPLDVKIAIPFALCLPGNKMLSQLEQETAIKRQIENLRVWRDVYYTQKPDGFPNASSFFSVTIPKDCYFLLGDNSCFSVDSRSWQNTFVTQCDMIGLISL